MPVRLSLPAQLPTAPRQCHELICEMARDIERYQSRIDYLTRRLFGRSSEQIDAGELTLFGDADFPGAEVEEEPAPEETEATEKTRKGPSRRNGRRPLPKDLPRKRVEYDVPAEEKVCCECGCDKKRIGEDTSEQLEYIPASLYVIEHVRLKYACPQCQGQVVQGEKPAQPIEKGLAGPGLLAHVITNKYCDHLPLHRQESIFARHGVDLSRKTLCDWMMQSAAVLAPVVKAMKREVLKSHSIHTDDTPVPVLDTGKTHRAYLWVYICDIVDPYTIYYSLGNWTALMCYTNDGRLAIDNNPAERALRHVVVGRKNWMFTGSERGGHAAATLYSLIASAKQNGLDPFAYLRDLLRRIPTHPHRRIGELFPSR